MKLSITQVTVMINDHGPDWIYLDTNLPSPFPPCVSEEALSLKSNVRAGGGVEYAQKHFPNIPLTIIDMDKGVRTVYQPDSRATLAAQELEAFLGVSVGAGPDILFVYTDGQPGTTPIPAEWHGFSVKTVVAIGKKRTVPTDKEAL